jgi:hypothetical protein
LEDIVTQALGDEADNDFFLASAAVALDWEIARQATVAAATVEVMRRVIFMGSAGGWGLFSWGVLVTDG